MTVFLRIVAALAYIMVAIAVTSMAGGGTDIQLIVIGLYATCGTVALAAAGILDRLAPRPDG